MGRRSSASQGPGLVLLAVGSASGRAIPTVSGRAELEARAGVVLHARRTRRYDSDGPAPRTRAAVPTLAAWTAIAAPARAVELVRIRGRRALRWDLVARHSRAAARLKSAPAEATLSTRRAVSAVAAEPRAQKRACEGQVASEHDDRDGTAAARCSSAWAAWTAPAAGSSTVIAERRTVGASRAPQAGAGVVRSRASGSPSDEPALEHRLLRSMGSVRPRLSPRSARGRSLGGAAARQGTRRVHLAERGAR